jgi:hypothetical protein
MIFGLVTETRNDVEYVRNIAFWVRKLFDLSQYRFETITSSQEIRISRTVYLIDASGGAVTVTLPPAKDAKGEWFLFKKTNNGSPNVTIDGNGSETIDGSATITINGHWDVRKLASDGVTWYVIQP